MAKNLKAMSKKTITLTLECDEVKVEKVFTVYDLKKILANEIIEKAAGQMASDLLETMSDD